MACWQSVNVGRDETGVWRESQIPKPELVALNVIVELYILMGWSGCGL